MRSLFDIFDEPEIQQRTPEANITLRPYQVEAVDAVYREWETVDSTIVVIPTGGGKSVVFSEIMRKWVEKKQ